MYAGHAALALLAKGIRPRISLAVLVPVAFGPDWIEWALSATGHENRILSHSLVSVAICATVVALVYWSFTRATVDACVVWLTYASHWPADFITGIKPTWPGGPDVGLRIYTNPVLDTAVEWTVVVLCWLVYRRSLPRQNRNRPLSYLVPAGLCAMQVGFHAIQTPEVRQPLHEIIGDAGSLRSRADRSLTLAADRFAAKHGAAAFAASGASALQRAQASARHRERSEPLHVSCNICRQTLAEPTMADDTGPRGLVTLVCITCGNEKHYDKRVPDAVTCDKCGGTVFRNFATPTEPDDATIASLEEQARSISYGDSSPDTAPGDVRDLDSR